MTQGNISRMAREDEENLSSDSEMELIEVLDAQAFLNGLGSDNSDDEGPLELDVEEAPYEPPRHDELVTFDKHTGSVFAACLNPDGTLAATGGEDDRFYIWKTSNAEVIFTSAEFKDSVTLVEFSFDGKYVAAADMNDKLVVWKVVEERVTEVFTDTVANIKWLKWHPQSNVLLVGSEMVWLIKIPSGQFKCFSTQEVASEIGNFMGDGKRAAVGCDDGSVSVLDLVTGNHVSKFTPAETTMDSITCLAVHPERDLVAVGSVNSKAALFKTQPAKIIGIFECKESDPVGGQDGDSQTSVESIAFGTVGLDSSSVMCAATDSALHVFDLSELRQKRHCLSVPEGITRFIWPQGSVYVYVATKRGDIAVWHPYTGVQMMSILGHSMTLLDINCNKAVNKLIAGGDDSMAKIFQIGETRPYHILPNHAQATPMAIS